MMNDEGRGQREKWGMIRAELTSAATGVWDQFGWASCVCVARSRWDALFFLGKADPPSLKALADLREDDRSPRRFARVLCIQG